MLSELFSEDTKGVRICIAAVCFNGEKQLMIQAGSQLVLDHLVVPSAPGYVLAARRDMKACGVLVRHERYYVLTAPWLVSSKTAGRDICAGNHESGQRSLKKPWQGEGVLSGDRSNPPAGG